MNTIYKIVGENLEQTYSSYRDIMVWMWQNFDVWELCDVMTEYDHKIPSNKIIEYRFKRLK